MLPEITYFNPNDIVLWSMTLTFNIDLGVIPGHVLTKFHDPNSKSFRDLNFGQVILVKYFWSSYRQTDLESDAYEPTVHTHRWAKKLYEF